MSTSPKTQQLSVAALLQSIRTTFGRSSDFAGPWLFLPRPVHRLDRRTSGLVLVAKTRSSMRRLSKAFASRTLFPRPMPSWCSKPTLHTVLLARRAGPGLDWILVDHPIERREARSEVRRLARFLAAEATMPLLGCGANKRCLFAGAGPSYDGTCTPDPTDYCQDRNILHTVIFV